MASGFGGAVKLKGESEYTKALNKITQNLKLVSSEMKLVSTSFDKNDTSIKSLTSKQDVLNKKLTEQTNKLGTLEKQYTSMNSKYQENTQKHNNLIESYNKEKAELDNIGQTLGKTSKEYKEQQEKVNLLANDVRKSTQAQEQNNKTMSNLQVTINNTKSEINKTSTEIKNLDNAISNENKTLAQNKTAYSQLTSTIESQKSKLESLKKEYTNTVLEQGKNSTSAKALGKEIKSLNTDLQNNEKKLKDAENGLEGVSQGTEKATQGFTVMKGALANLVSSGIQSAISAVKNLAKETMNVGMNFEQAMAKVSAVSGATGKDLDDLTAKAKEMGSKTKFTATESAEAFNYMAMAGWKTSDMLNGIEGIMNLAAASGEDLATTSDIVTDALTAMGYSAKESGRLADVMAAASSNSNTNVSMMGETFKYVAPIVGALGYSMEDTAVSIGLMANSGIKAEKAGTALRSILTRLSAPPKACAEAMDALGISITNADGTMKPLSQLIDELREKFKGLSETQQTQYAKGIAGQEAMSGLLAIVKAAPEDVEKLTDAINNSNGAAQSMADTMNNTVSGQITLLKSKIEGIMIKIFEKASGSIRQAIDKISEALDTIDWDKFAQEVGDALNKVIDLFKWFVDNKELVVGAITAILTAFTIGKIASFINTIVTLGTTLAGIPAVVSAVSAAGTALGAVFTFITGPIGIAIAAIGAIVAGFIALWNNCEEFRNFWINLWENIKTGLENAWSSISTFFTETIPGAFTNLLTTIQGWWNNVVTFITNIPTYVSQIIQSVITFFNELPYKIGYAIGEMLGHIIKFGQDAWTWVTTEVPKIIEGIVTFFKELPGKVGEFLVQTVTKIGEWAVNMKNKAVETGKNFINSITTFFKELPGKVWNFLSSTISKVQEFATNIANKARDGARNMKDNIVNGIKELPSKMLDMGKNIVEGLWNGIKNAGNWIKDKVKDFAKGILDGMKNALGIHSPSRVFRDQVGKYIAEGIGVGFSDEMDNVSKEMQNAIPTSFDTDIKANVGSNITGTNINSIGSSNNYSYDNMVNAFKTALAEMKIELDDEVAGKFVRKTIEDAICT